MTIDYARMQRRHGPLKGSLTRATKKGPLAVIDAVEAAYDEFDEIGCWPDDWHRWARALDDAVWTARREDIELPEHRVTNLVRRG